MWDSRRDGHERFRDGTRAVEAQRCALGRLRKAMTCVSQREKRQDSKPKGPPTVGKRRGGAPRRARGDRARMGKMGAVRAFVPRKSRTVSSRGRCVARRETRGGGCRSESREFRKWRQSQNAALPLVDTARLEVATHPSRKLDFADPAGKFADRAERGPQAGIRPERGENEAKKRRSARRKWPGVRKLLRKSATWSMTCRGAATQRAQSTSARNQNITVSNLLVSLRVEARQQNNVVATVFGHEQQISEEFGGRMMCAGTARAASML